MTADDHRLTELVQDAAAGIEPTDRLGVIRGRVDDSTRRRRAWWVAGGGGVLVAAATVAAVALTGGLTGVDRATPSDPAAPGSPSTSAPADGSSETPSAVSPPLTTALPVYLLGDTPVGPRLFREFQLGPGDDQVTEAARRAVAGPPLDPDYRTAWPSGAGVTSTERAGAQVILVDLHSDGADLTDRPANLTDEQARLAIQQVVYSVQGAARVRMPVQIRVDGKVVDTVLGVPTGRPLDRDPDALALVNVTAPEQGQVVSGRLEASGVANSFEATVPWEVLDSSGDPVLTGFATAEGAYDRLYPWTTTIDLTGLSPGDYTFVARTDDPSGGEGPGPVEDTKDFRID